ncbi:MAG: photosystem reaction center subunit H [Thermoplasmata archaeon HGW-Thermoplasmata-2]|nr:MAG: photosystem reaction center subunit H [Thermoplasmata archaeon HGW-Thermoplasmata-2]
MSMVMDVDAIVNLPVYTPKGMYVGDVQNVILDIDGKKVDGMYITKINPSIMEGNTPVSVPMRWVGAIGDIIILKYFPGKIAMPAKKEEEK